MKLFKGVRVERETGKGSDRGLGRIRANYGRTESQTRARKADHEGGQRQARCQCRICEFQQSER